MNASNLYSEDAYTSSPSSKEALRRELEEQLEVFKNRGGKILPPDVSAQPKLAGNPWTRTSRANYEANLKRDTEHGVHEKKHKSIKPAKAHQGEKDTALSLEFDSLTARKPNKYKLHYVPTLAEFQQFEKNYRNKLSKSNAKRRTASHCENSEASKQRKAEHERKLKVIKARDEAIAKSPNSASPEVIYFTAPCKHHNETTFQYKNTVTRCVKCLKGGAKKTLSSTDKKQIIYAQNREKMKLAIAKHEKLEPEGHIHFQGTCIKCGPDMTLRVRFLTKNGIQTQTYCCVTCQAVASIKSEKKRLTKKRENNKSRKFNNTSLMEIAIKLHETENTDQPIIFSGECLHCGPASDFLVTLKTVDSKKIGSYSCIACDKENPYGSNKYDEIERKQKVSQAREKALNAGEIYFMAPCKHHDETTFYTTEKTTWCVACSKNVPAGKTGESFNTIKKEHARLKNNRELMVSAINAHSTNQSAKTITFIANCGTCGEGALMKVCEGKNNVKPFYFCVQCAKDAQSKHQIKKANFQSTDFTIVQRPVLPSHIPYK